ncbi:MAG: hypothetical protein R3F29_09870 [Planctomycetota bacterium]
MNAVIGLVLAANLLAQGGAQCGFAWQSVGGYPGADGIVECAVEWDPDGAGPAPTLAVLGGQFSVVGTAVASHLALYEPITDTWAGLGGGVDGPVYALLPLANGELIVAGDFTNAGGVPCNNVARWDGVGWQPLGGASNGTDGLVVALAMLPTGEIVVGGAFASAGGVAAANVASWDGTSWSPLGTGCNARVNALAVAANGELFVGGQFTAAGGVAASRVARWNGAWAGVGNGVTWTVLSMAFSASGDLLAAIANPPQVMRWNGTAWTTAGNGLQFHEGSHALRVAPSGDLLMCGRAVLGDPSLFRWTGSSWTAIASTGGGGVTSIRAFVQFGSGDYLLGGSFASPSPCVARFVGGARVAIEGALQSECIGLAETDTGVVVAATTAGLRHETPTGWGRYGSTSEEVTGPMASWIGDGVVVAGAFTHYWTDQWGNTYTSYHPGRVVTPTYSSYLYSPDFSASFPTPGYAVTRMPNGHVLVSYSGFGSRIGEYDEAGQIGVAGPPLVATALTARSDQDWIAAANGVIYQRLAGAWSVIGTAGAEVRCLVTAPNGDVYAGGQFTSIDGVTVDRLARWDGTTWHAVGGGTDGMVRAILPLPNGDVVVGGAFQHAGGVATPHLARWNGTSWSGFGASPGAPVEALTQDRLGRIWVGGLFTRVGGTVCSYLARLDPICAGTVASYGTGCSGTGGANTLTAKSLPWRDATFRSRAAGMQPNSIAVLATGFAPLALPLQQLFPFALPGCDLLATPDVTSLALTGIGAFDVELFLPASSVWLGQQLRQQVIGVELDAAGQLTGLSSSNALLLTVGQL